MKRSDASLKEPNFLEEKNMKNTIMKKELVLFFLVVLLFFLNAPALSEQMTVNDKIYSMVADRFPVTELDIGELAVAEGNEAKAEPRKARPAAEGGRERPTKSINQYDKQHRQ